MNMLYVDGDDPLTATEYMDITMDVLLADTSLDIVTVDGLLSLRLEFSRRAIEGFGAYLTKENDTGFIYFFTKTACNHQIVRCKTTSSASKREAHPRLSEDFELFTKIFDGAKSQDKS